MKRLTLGLCGAFIGLVLSCSKSDQEKAQRTADSAEQKAERATKKAEEELRKAGREAKAETAVLGKKIDQSLKGSPGRDTASTTADEKLHAAGRKTRDAGERASVKLTHAALIAKVKSTLVTDVGLATLGSIDVDTTGHIVTLNGTVDTAEQKQRAEQAVAQIDGVSKVINHLSVK